MYEDKETRFYDGQNIRQRRECRTIHFVRLVFKFDLDMSFILIVWPIA